jgi:hypothetical protein
MIVFDVFQDSISGITFDGVLEQITDYPDAVNRAVVGYQYSSAQQQKSVPMEPQNTVAIFTQQSGVGNAAVMYINLLWRVFSSVPLLHELPEANVASEDQHSDSDSEIEVIRSSRKSSKKYLH